MRRYVSKAERIDWFVIALTLLVRSERQEMANVRIFTVSFSLKSIKRNQESVLHGFVTQNV